MNFRLPIAALLMLLAAVSWLPAQDAAPPGTPPVVIPQDKQTAPEKSVSEKAPSEKNGDRAPLVYRIVKVPEKSLKEFAEGYRAIRLDEFQKKLEAIATKAGPMIVPTDRITRAEYSARFADGQLIGGQAKLDVEHLGEAASVLPLEPCGLAIGLPPPEAEPSAVARLGLTGDGRLAAILEKSGTLQFPWSLRGTRDASGTAIFKLDLPEGMASRLVLDLPVEMTPTVDRGVVSNPLAVELTVDAQGTKQKANRFIVELGVHHRVQLRVVPKQTRTRQLGLRKNLSYDLSLRGLEISGELLLDVYHEPLSQLELQLDAPLQFSAAKFAGRDMAWTLVDAGAPGKPSKIVLQFAEPLIGMQQTVRIWALAPIKREVEWTLPGIHIPGAQWRSGSATLLVTEPLILERVIPSKCRQTKVETLPSPRVGELLEFQQFVPDSALRVKLARQPTQAQVETLTNLVIGPATTQATTHATLVATQGALFEIEANVPRPWGIDSVEGFLHTASGATLVATFDDWTVIDPGSDQQVLRVRLRDALRPDTVLKLTVRGQRSSNLKRRTDAPTGRNELLQLVGFRNLKADRQTICVQASNPYQLRLTGDAGLSRIEPGSLPAADARLLEMRPNAVLFSLNAGAASLVAEVASEKATFQADLHVDVALSAGRITESYKITCMPDSAPVDRLRVRLSAARQGNLIWSLTGEPPLALAATRADRAAKEDELGQEEWDVHLPRPMSGTFVLHATRDTPLTANAAISLAALPDAALQSGTLTVVTLGESVVSLDNQRLKPLIADPVATIQLPAFMSATTPPTLRKAIYRYEPTRDVLAAREPSLFVAPLEDPAALPLAWISQLNLCSRWSSSGEQFNLAMAQVENTGAQSTTVSLPDDALPEEVRVDGIAYQAHQLSAPDDSRSLRIPLPQGRRRVQLAIRFRTPAHTISLAGRIAAPLVKFDLPAMTKSWRLVLPADYAVYRADQHASRSSVASTPWDRRLFGNLRPEPESDNPELTADNASQSLLSRFTEFHGATHQQELGEDGQASVRVFHPATSNAWGWVFFWLSAALGWRLLPARRIPLTIGAGVCAALTLLVTQPWVPLCGGLWLGAVLAGGLRLVWPRRPIGALGKLRDDTAPASTHLLAPVRAMTLLIVLLAVFGLRHQLAAQDSPPSSPPSTPATVTPPVPPAPTSPAIGEPRTGEAAPRPIHPVIVPVDDKGVQAGQYVYVPISFLDELNKRAAALTGQSTAWILRSATYRGAAVWRSTPARLDVPELKAIYEIEVLEAKTRVLIPLGREGVTLLEEGARLDGRLVQPSWTEDGSALTFDDIEPGIYRLELLLRPTPRTSDSTTSIELTIPRLARSRVELDVPEDAPEIEIPASFGTVNQDKDGVSAELGPTRNLTLRWAEGTTGDRAQPEVHVEELLWFHIRQGSVELETQFKFKPVKGRLRRMRIVADGRLVWLPHEAGSPDLQVRVAPGDLQTVLLEWKRPVSDEVTFRARFRLADTRGIGVLSLPRIETQADKVTRRWVAASVDTGLQFDRPAAAYKDVSLDQLTKVWGPQTATPPQLLVDVPQESAGSGNRPAWNLSVRPLPPETTYGQSLQMSFDRDGATAWFHVDLATRGGVVFQHRLLLPPELAVEEVSVTDNAQVQRLARWSRDAAGGLTLFLIGPSDGALHASVRGRLPVTWKKEYALPKFSLDSGPPASRRIVLLRQPGVLVQPVKTAGLQPLAEPLPGEQTVSGRIVGRWFAPQPDFDARVLVVPNEPKTRGVQTTLVRAEQDGWVAEADYRLSVTAGEVDTLRFEIPPQLSPDLSLIPAYPFELQAMPGENRRWLVVHPPEAIRDRLALKIRGKISGGPREVRVPDILPVDVDELERYVLLPGRDRAKRIEWETRELREAPLPAGFEIPINPAEEYSTYRVIGQPFQAVRASVRQISGTPRVVLADVRVTWQANGQYHGIAAFDLEPAGLMHCQLQLPVDCTLLHAEIGGLPATVRSHTAGEWELGLVSDQLPQHIEVVFMGRRPENANARHVRLFAPWLSGIDVEQTLWTVFGPQAASLRGTEPLERQEAERREIAAKQDLARLRTYRELVDLPTDLVKETQRAEIESWYPAWAGRFDKTAESLHRRTDAAELSAEVKTLRKELDLASQRIGAEQLRPAREAVEFAGAKWPADETAWRNVSDVSQREVEISYELPHSPLPGRLLVVLVIGLVTAGLCWMMKTPTAVEWLARWSHVIGVAFGVGWWLWFSPAWLGLFIAAVSLIVSLWPAFPHPPKGRRFGDARSVIRNPGI